MTVDIDSEEARIIRQMIPLATLPSNRFAELCAQINVESAEAGQVLFRRGDNDSDLYYLIDGSVNLQTEAFTVETITAGSESARFAIAHQIPRKIDAIAKSRIQFLRLNANMMQIDRETAYEENDSTMMVEDSGGDEDWMTTLLKSPIFRMLPPANLQRILISLEEISFHAGETIIRQGDPGDYYYVIKKGKALISRKPSPNAKEIKLAQLGDLDSFGEDSLISGEPRNVSVTAETDITLLRLSKDQFINLIKKPTLKYVEFDKLDEQLRNGAQLIDVRGPDEFKNHKLPRSTNIPFFSLRMQMKSLDRHRPIIVVCKDGRTSESAAFVLHRFKFNASVLKGGMAGIEQAETKAEPAIFTIDDGTETANLQESSTRLTSKTLPEENDFQQEQVEVVDDINQLVEQLKARCKILEAEKTTLELKCNSLSRQLDTVKAELGILKMKGGG
ncbi:cyclic nucleotide-binding domain-containing protein [Methylomonas sp. MgM2]